MNDRRAEIIIARLLQTGVLLAAGLMSAAGAVYLLSHGGSAVDYHVFRGEPRELRSVAGVLGGALRLESRAWMQLGLLLLFATPLARVAFAAVAFALERDRLYVVVALVVLATLLFSLSGSGAF